MRGDVLSVEGDTQAGEPLVVPVMRGGKRLAPAALADIRERARGDLARLPAALAQLAPGDYPVTIAPTLRALAVETDRLTKR
jgi:nicotinate phosphoribosyltransferase